MSYLETQLLQIDGVFEIQQHKQTLSKGWYSIMTTATTFKQTTKLHKSHPVTCVTEIINTQGIHVPQFPKPTLCFKRKNLKRNQMEMTLSLHLLYYILVSRELRQ